MRSSQPANWTARPCLTAEPFKPEFNKAQEVHKLHYNTAGRLRGLSWQSKRITPWLGELPAGRLRISFGGIISRLKASFVRNA
ncbi:MAG: hypothetical protein AAGN82_17185 [Myxococcota bacterium]